MTGARYTLTSMAGQIRAGPMLGSQLDEDGDRGVVVVGGLGTPPPDRRLDASVNEPVLTQWIEVWDYTGGTRFRGFIAEKLQDRTLFVFFDELVVGKDLKQGYVSLLCTTDICLGRSFN